MKLLPSGDSSHRMFSGLIVVILLLAATNCHDSKAGAATQDV